MATEIRMPRLGWTMEEGIFGEWLKKDGETIQSGDFLFTIEGDKATQEIEAFDSGILRIPPNAAKPGDLITVGTVLAYTVRPGENFDFGTQSVAQSTAATVAAQVATAVTADALSEQSKIQGLSWQEQKSKIAISPRARRVASELGVDWHGLTGSGSSGRIIERDIRAAAAAAATKPVEQPTAGPEEKVRATPIAVRMAQEAGIDLAELAAQKPGERIDRADVEAVIAARAATLAAPAPSTAVEAMPVTNIRRLIAQRMLESAQGTAAVTLTTEVDATALVKLREELKTAFAPRGYAVPSYNDLFAKLTAVALQEHPLLNARWQGDEIVLNKAVHIGIAVDTPEGLLVPVVRNVHSQSLREIAAQSKALIEKALARKLSAAELQDGTFTITNLGIYNIDAFTPIINPPQCAILGIGRIVKKPAVVGEKIKARDMVALSLTFDHRIVDGAPAARFLDLVRQLIETPVLWLAG